MIEPAKLDKKIISVSSKKVCIKKACAHEILIKSSTIYGALLMGTQENGVFKETLKIATTTETVEMSAKIK